MCVLVAQLSPTLCRVRTVISPGSSVHGILQTRILEWVAISYSRGSSQPRDWTWVSHIAGRFFTLWAAGETPSPLGLAYSLAFLSPLTEASRRKGCDCRPQAVAQTQKNVCRVTTHVSLDAPRPAVPLAWTEPPCLHVDTLSSLRAHLEGCGATRTHCPGLRVTSSPSWTLGDPRQASLLCTLSTLTALFLF